MTLRAKSILLDINVSTKEQYLALIKGTYSFFILNFTVKIHQYEFNNKLCTFALKQIHQRKKFETNQRSLISSRDQVIFYENQITQS